jgi:hypothetical protein
MGPLEFQWQGGSTFTCLMNSDHTPYNFQKEEKSTLIQSTMPQTTESKTAQAYMTPQTKIISILDEKMAKTYLKQNREF